MRSSPPRTCTSACPGPHEPGCGGSDVVRCGRRATSRPGGQAATSPLPPRSARPSAGSAAPRPAKPSVECDVIPLTRPAARGITSHSTLKVDEHGEVWEVAVARDELLADDPPAHPLVEAECARPGVGPEQRRTALARGGDAFGEHQPAHAGPLLRRVN